MLKIKHVAVCMLALAMLSAGCTNYSGNTYTGSQVRSAQTVQYGTVVSVQPVTLEEDRPAVLGTVGGGVVGGGVVSRRPPREGHFALLFLPLIHTNRRYDNMRKEGSR